MAVLVIPTRQDVPHYTFEIDLDQSTFGFEFHWNDRDAAWYFDLYEGGIFDEAHLLLAGRKVLLGCFFLNRFRDPRLPAGVLEVIDTSGQNRDAGLTELGTRVRLLYTEAADIPAGLTG